MNEPLARSAQVGQARALLARAVDVIRETKAAKSQSRGLVVRSRERVVWSDHLLGVSRGLIDQLRDSVALVATLEHESGAPPERVVTLLKGLVNDAGALRLEPADARSLTEDVVRWAIEGYYAA